METVKKVVSRVKSILEIFLNFFHDSMTQSLSWFGSSVPMTFSWYDNTCNSIQGSLVLTGQYPHTSPFTHRESEPGFNGSLIKLVPNLSTYATPLLLLVASSKTGSDSITTRVHGCLGGCLGGWVCVCVRIELFSPINHERMIGSSSKSYIGLISMRC